MRLRLNPIPHHPYVSDRTKRNSLQSSRPFFISILVKQWILLGVTTLLIVSGNCGITVCQEPVADFYTVAPEDVSQALRRVTEDALSSVVTIETLSGPGNTSAWARYRSSIRALNGAISADAIGRKDQSMDHAYAGSGSGIIIDRRGFILTCYHVIDDANVVFVKLSDGRVLEPVDVFVDELTDLALIRVAVDGQLPEARLGNSDELATGDLVVCLGNPYGLGLAASSGIVSAVDRQLLDTPWTRLIQSDAASNPGNSGGALINVKGELVGISEGAYSASEGFQGIGFAIPVNAAMRIARKLIAHGEVRRAYLGCQSQVLTPAAAQHLGLAKGSGLIVCDVAPDSAASKAGVEVGDVLISFSGILIRDGYHLHELLEEAKLDQADTLTLDIRLAPMAATKVQNEIHDEHQHEQEPANLDASLEISVEDLSPDAARELGYDENQHGVLITYVKQGGIAYKQGLRAGMLILRVENSRTPNLAEYQKASHSYSSREGILMLVATAEGQHYLFLTLSP